jgi:hypothetical protein
MHDAAAAADYACAAMIFHALMPLLPPFRLRHAIAAPLLPLCRLVSRRCPACSPPFAAAICAEARSAPYFAFRYYFASADDTPMLFMSHFMPLPLNQRHIPP